jgi:hypothetical protein
MPGGSGFLAIRQILKQRWRGPSPVVRVISCDDVFGFCDVIAEIETDTKFEDFYDAVLKEVDSLPDVRRMRTYPVLRASQAKPITRAVSAYVFVNAVPQMALLVQEALMGLDDISSADIVTGIHDIITKTTVLPSQLAEYGSEILSIKGILSTESLIPHDLFRSGISESSEAAKTSP